MTNYFKYFFLLLLIYSIVIAFIGISCDTFYTIKYGGIDLRNRVVGARVWLDGRDPYFTKWDENTPDYFLDGRDYFYDLPVSRCTVTPSFLMLHLPLASINYKTQQYIWFILQELMLLTTIYILAFLAKNKFKLVLIIGFLFQFGAYFWRFHVANGQIYVLFLFMITLAYLFVKSNLKYSSFWAGLILGITATWRPPLLIMGIPFLIFKKWKLISGGFCGIVLGFVSSLFINGIDIWRSYFAAMKIVEQFHLGLIDFKLLVHDHFNNVEGVTNSFFSADVPGLDASIQGFLFNQFETVVHSRYLWSALFIITIGLSIYLLKKRNENKSWEIIFFWGVTLLFLSEFFLPAARLSYNNVLWLLPISLLIIETNDPTKLIDSPLILFILGILLNYLYNLHILTIIFADFTILFYLIFMWFKIDRVNLGTPAKVS
ncbi:MAG: glycosyltransferase 87 family protein [Candidatus Cloacimonetes bacterium]|nr:glycosyltransferase 87 family protein [Candidatus Cloacimonadota bacterium]MCF7869367.1 glycosyltransferase 87 family protein [Candidatus Cloacimonadota bacterium]